jgi:hypothetical protein
VRTQAAQSQAAKPLPANPEALALPNGPVPHNLGDSILKLISMRLGLIIGHCFQLAVEAMPILFPKSGLSTLRLDAHPLGCFTP